MKFMDSLNFAIKSLLVAIFILLLVLLFARPAALINLSTFSSGRFLRAEKTSSSRPLTSTSLPDWSLLSITDKVAFSDIFLDFTPDTFFLLSESSSFLTLFDKQKNNLLVFLSPTSKERVRNVLSFPLLSFTSITPIFSFSSDLSSLALLNPTKNSLTLWDTVIPDRPILIKDLALDANSSVTRIINQGTAIILISRSGSIEIINPKGNSYVSFPYFIPGCEEVKDAVVTSNRLYLACSGKTPFLAIVAISDVGSPLLIHTFTLPFVPTALAYKKGSEILAIGGEDLIKLYDLKNELLLEEKSSLPLESVITHLAFKGNSLHTYLKNNFLFIIAPR